MLESLEKMLAKGVDNSLLRFGLGKGYLDLGDNLKAAEHLQRCVGFDPKYSAAWKLLANLLPDVGATLPALLLAGGLQWLLGRWSKTA